MSSRRHLIAYLWTGGQLAAPWSDDVVAPAVQEAIGQAFVPSEGGARPSVQVVEEFGPLIYEDAPAETVEEQQRREAAERSGDGFGPLRGWSW